MIIDYKIVPFHFFYDEKTRYKVRMKKKLWIFSWWVWLEDYNDFDDETGGFRLRFFEEEKEAHNFMKGIIRKSEK